MAIVFPNLPYSKNALAPHMSRETLEVHYGRHHKKYVEITNELVKGTPLDKMTLEEILFATASAIDKKLYNNAAQAWNHAFFWNCLTSASTEPSKHLRRMFTHTFDSFEKFKTEFEKQASELFGSGWVWLVIDKKGNFRIRALANAGNPLAEFHEIPLLVCDVWEHAYYLDFKNDRVKFLQGFWQIVDWQFVEKTLESARNWPNGSHLTKSQSSLSLKVI